MSHQWIRIILAPERIREKDNTLIPQIISPFIRCKVCQIQVTQLGRGAKASLIYRQTSDHEWEYEEPECELK